MDSDMTGKARYGTVYEMTKYPGVRFVLLEKAEQAVATVRLEVLRKVEPWIDQAGHGSDHELMQNQARAEVDRLEKERS